MGYQNLLSRNSNGTNRNQKQTQPMKQTFDIPENTKSVLVEKTESGIHIEFIPNEPKFKAGDVVVLSDFMCKNTVILACDSAASKGTFETVCSLAWNNNNLSKGTEFFGWKATFATPEQRQLLFDRIDSEGYEYNHETMKLEKKRWKPEIGEQYFTPFVGCHSVWNNIGVDINRFMLNAVFKTPSEAKEAEQRFAELYK